MKYYLTTLGCPKNEADSRDIETSLLMEGFSKAKHVDDADFHIINTCAFIEEAKKETIQEIFRAISIKEKLKEKNKDQKVIVVGCFSERYSKEIKEEIPEIDLFFGTNQYRKTGEILKTHFHLEIQKPSDYVELWETLKAKKKFYAPVKISEGCNRNCAFCAIPLFRGKFQSFEKESILEQVRFLAQTGIKEICIVSQDTNSYGSHYNELVDLLELIQEIEGIQWIRLLYMYPDQKTMRILKEIHKRKIYKIVPYLESPIQHVSEKVLKKMNRYGSYEFFKDLFQMARDLFSDLEIRTTFLIGFPEEDAHDIALIQRFIEETKIEHLTFFAYSPEEGTQAYEFSSKINRKEIKNKINEIQNFYNEILRDIMSNHVGKIYYSLLEGIKPNELYFRRPQSAPEIDDIVVVSFDYKQWKQEKKEPPKLGEFYPIEITGFVSYDYTGRILSEVGAIL